MQGEELKGTARSQAEPEDEEEACKGMWAQRAAAAAPAVLCNTGSRVSRRKHAGGQGCWRKEKKKIMPVS